MNFTDTSYTALYGKFKAQSLRIKVSLQMLPQTAFTCANSTIEPPEQCVKSAQR